MAKAMLGFTTHTTDVLFFSRNATPEEFYRLYDVTAKHLKACFPHIKVGGC